MKVRSKKIIESKIPIPVYDLEVPTVHNFALDNGIIVHNSDGSKDILDSLCGSIWTCSTNLNKSAGAQNIQNLDTSIRMMSRTGSTNMFKRFENKLLGASR